MFTYHSGESFDGFNQCGLEADTKTEECVENPPAVLKRICGSDNPACMIDGCVGGPDEAINYIESQDDMVDKMCGQQIFFEDFDQKSDGPWGDIVEKGGTKYLQLSQENPSITRTFSVPSEA